MDLQLLTKACDFLHNYAKMLNNAHWGMYSGDLVKFCELFTDESSSITHKIVKSQITTNTFIEYLASCNMKVIFEFTDTINDDKEYLRIDMTSSDVPNFSKFFVREVKWGASFISVEDF